MKYKLQLGVSETQSRNTIDTELDLGFTSEEWSELSEDEQAEEIGNHIDGFDQPYWVIEKTTKVNDL